MSLYLLSPPHLLRLLVLLSAVLSTCVGTVHAQTVNATSDTQPGIQCTADARITEVFDNGAVWDMCWESRIRENLVLSDVYYTPPGGQPFRVLASARLSQLHVAYDDSDVTYNDVTQYGLGGGYLLTLANADCPNGQLLNIQSRPALCRWRGTAETGYRTASRATKTQSLNLFSVSQVGAYAYIIAWTFYADGAFEPGVGATGALQRSSDNTELPFGRVLQGDPDTLWLSHTHNYYWRLDFDIGSSATDDQFSEQRFVLAEDGTRQFQQQVFTTEQARRLDPDTQQTWKISDNGLPNSPAFVIEPLSSGHRFERKDVEPDTDYDFFVTVANDCERFASQNARFNPDCLNHVLQYVDNQSIENQDLVLWHRVSFHHVPRNEDQRHMHTHWDGFVIQPENLLSGTNNLAGQPNTSPVFNAIAERRTNTQELVHENLLATDPDGDVLTYLATGLPPGIRLSAQGHLHGKATVAGAYQVSVSARDDHDETTTEFSWVVADPTQSSKSGGLIHWVTLMLLLLIVGSRLRWVYS